VFFELFLETFVVVRDVDTDTTGVGGKENGWSTTGVGGKEHGWSYKVWDNQEFKLNVKK
jgi:hypothetical protein